MTGVAPSFPADQLEMHYRRRIAALHGPDPEQAARLAIRFCHVTTLGEQAPWAGLGEALHELLAAAAAGTPSPPMLVFGLHAVEWVRAHPRATLLKWPGAAYLRYDVGDTELIAAVRATIAGADQAVSSDLLPTTAEIRTVLSDVRHWLENRLRNTEGAKVDLAAAARGERELHESYLAPVVAISSRHQQSLARLRNLEPAIAARLRERAEFSGFDAALDEFVRCWANLERARGEAREATREARAAHLSEARDHCDQVGRALMAAVATLDELDRALGAGEE